MNVSSIAGLDVAVDPLPVKIGMPAVNEIDSKRLEFVHHFPQCGSCFSCSRMP